MVSGQDDRNQALMRLSLPGNHMPQWCPARKAGIAVSLGNRGEHPGSRASMVSGQDDRNQHDQLLVVKAVVVASMVSGQDDQNQRVVPGNGDEVPVVASMVSGQDGRNQFLRGRQLLHAAIASMVSGQDDRNQTQPAG